MYFDDFWGIYVKNVRFVHEHLLHSGLAKSEKRKTHTNIQTTEVKSSFIWDWLAIYQGMPCSWTILIKIVEKRKKECKFKPLWDPFMRRTNCKPTKKKHACNKPCLNHAVFGCKALKGQNADVILHRGHGAISKSGSGKFLAIQLLQPSPKTNGIASR